MDAENMKELHLAGGRFVKVEEWQNEPTPKKVTVKSGAMLRDPDYMYLGTFKANTSFTASAFGKAMLKKEDGTIYHDNDGTTVEYYAVYAGGPISGQGRPLTGTETVTHVLGSMFFAKVVDCTPVTETIGGVLHSLISWLLPKEVVAC